MKNLDEIGTIIEIALEKAEEIKGKQALAKVKTDANIKKFEKLLKDQAALYKKQGDLEQKQEEIAEQITDSYTELEDLESEIEDLAMEIEEKIGISVNYDYSKKVYKQPTYEVSEDNLIDSKKVSKIRTKLKLNLLKEDNYQDIDIEKVIDEIVKELTK